jgi:hypothetical protein
MCSCLRRQTRSHLEYLHLQILSVVTVTQLRRIFERRTNFDLGRLLGGTHILKLSFPKLIFERIRNSYSFVAGEGGK